MISNKNAPFLSRKHSMKSPLFFFPYDALCLVLAE